MSKYLVLRHQINRLTMFEDLGENARRSLPIFDGVCTEVSNEDGKQCLSVLVFQVAAVGLGAMQARSPAICQP